MLAQVLHPADGHRDSIKETSFLFPLPFYFLHFPSLLLCVSVPVADYTGFRRAVIYQAPPLFNRRSHRSITAAPKSLTILFRGFQLNRPPSELLVIAEEESASQDGVVNGPVNALVHPFCHLLVGNILPLASDNIVLKKIWMTRSKSSEPLERSSPTVIDITDLRGYTTFQRLWMGAFTSPQIQFEE